MSMLKRCPHVQFFVVLERIKILTQGSRKQDWILSEGLTNGFSDYTDKASTCGIIVSPLRRSCRPIAWMATSSIEMEPLADSIMRNSDSVSEDLPAPVRPTMPTCVPETMKDNYPGICTQFHESAKSRSESPYPFSRVEHARDSFEHEVQARTIASAVILYDNLSISWPICRRLCLRDIPERLQDDIGVALTS